MLININATQIPAYDNKTTNHNTLLAICSAILFNLLPSWDYAVYSIEYMTPLTNFTVYSCCLGNYFSSLDVIFMRIVFSQPHAPAPAAVLVDLYIIPSKALAK